MAQVEVLNRETGEFTMEEQDMRPVELGGATRLQRALESVVRREFEAVCDAYHPSLERALAITRLRTNGLMKELVNEAMENLGDAVKPKQMTMTLPANRS